MGRLVDIRIKPRPLLWRKWPERRPQRNRKLLLVAFGNIGFGYYFGDSSPVEIEIGLLSARWDQAKNVLWLYESDLLATLPKLNEK